MQDDAFKPYDQVNVLALDSVCWDVLLPLVEDGTMPALGAFLSHAHYGNLISTIPPHTAAAWTTWLTGKDPGQHGIIDFVRFDPTTHRFRFHDSTVQRASSLFSLLSSAKISCGSIFLPRNYPPYPLHEGYMVSGFETPSVKSHFTEPEALREEVSKLSPELHFNFEDDWEKDVDDDAFERNIARAMGSVELLEKLAVNFQRTHPTRVQVAYLQATDILFHKAWKWCDPKTASGEPRRRKLIQKFFRRIDDAVGRILKVSSGEKRKILQLICSDHGHGSSDGRVFVNNLLEDWGFLKRLAGFSKIARRVSSLSLSKAARKTSNKQLTVDWRRTRAYMAHVGIHGFVYLNLQGREPHGIVKPGEFESVRNHLIERFRAVRIPESDEPVFRNVWKGDELYARKQELNLPDIVLAATRGYFPRNKLSKKKHPVLVAHGAIGGVHRPEGVYAFSGTDVVPSGGLAEQAGIADICPTILAALGQPIPADVTGKPMQFLFRKPLPLRNAAAPESTGADPAANVYSSEEAKAVEKRLADLGYLE